MLLLYSETSYDTVCLNCLPYKLISLNLPDDILSFFKSYLEGNTFTVHLKDSIPKPTRSGIRSTTLFSFYLSGMPHPPRTHFTVDAEDTALLSQPRRL
jgi:hypothetical protein